MKSSKIYLIGLLVMLIMNGTLIFLFLKKPAHGNRQKQKHPPKNIINKVSKQLDFNEDQTKQYRKMAQEHRNLINELERQQAELIGEYFSLIGEEKDTFESKKLTILDQLKMMEERKLNSTFDHFQELKELCGEEQQQNFEKTVQELIKVITNSDKGGPPPPPR